MTHSPAESSIEFCGICILWEILGYCIGLSDWLSVCRGNCWQYLLLTMYTALQLLPVHTYLGGSRKRNWQFVASPVHLCLNRPVDVFSRLDAWLLHMVKVCVHHSPPLKCLTEIGCYEVRFRSTFCGGGETWLLFRGCIFCLANVAHVTNSEALRWVHQHLLDTLLIGIQTE